MKRPDLVAAGPTHRAPQSGPPYLDGDRELRFATRPAQSVPAAPLPPTPGREAGRLMSRPRSSSDAGSQQTVSNPEKVVQITTGDLDHEKHVLLSQTRISSRLSVTDSFHLTTY